MSGFFPLLRIGSRVKSDCALIILQHSHPSPYTRHQSRDFSSFEFFIVYFTRTASCNCISPVSRC